MDVFLFGGENRIRTCGTLPHTRFPSVLLQPLGHLSVLLFILPALANIPIDNSKLYKRLPLVVAHMSNIFL